MHRAENPEYDDQCPAGRERPSAVRGGVMARRGRGRFASALGRATPNGGRGTAGIMYHDPRTNDKGYPAGTGAKPILSSAISDHSSSRDGFMLHVSYSHETGTVEATATHQSRFAQHDVQKIRGLHKDRAAKPCDGVWLITA